MPCHNTSAKWHLATVLKTTEYRPSFASIPLWGAESTILAQAFLLASFLAAAEYGIRNLGGWKSAAAAFYLEKEKKDCDEVLSFLYPPMW